VQDFSHISEKNVGIQLNFSRIFTYRDNSANPNISQISFQPAGILNKSAWGLIKDQLITSFST